MPTLDRCPMPDALYLLVMVPVVPAVVAAWASVKSARIVSGNGRGTVTEMVEDLCDWRDRHEIEHKIIDLQLDK